MKYLKYITVVVFFVLISSTTILTINANATPPRYMKLQYQPNSDSLKVTILHFSPARKIHYVYRVVVEKNGKIDQVHFYDKQPRFLIYTYTYNISAQPDDIITVSSYFILFGFLQKSNTIPNKTTRSIIIPK